MSNLTTLTALTQTDERLRKLLTQLERVTRTSRAAHDVRNALSVIGTYKEIVTGADIEETDLLYDACQALVYAEGIIARIGGAEPEEARDPLSIVSAVWST